jgi:ribosomal protein L2
MNVGSNRQLAGEYGGRYITASDGTVTGNWMEIHAVATTILGAVTSNITNFPAGVTVQAGDSLSGVYTSLAVSSGAIIAYNRKWV